MKRGIEIPCDGGTLAMLVPHSVVENLKKICPELDFTPIGGSLEQRIAALNALIDEKHGKGSKGAIHPSDAIYLSERFGVDALQALFDSGRFTGM